MRQKQGTDESRVESRDERRAPVESRAERWQTREQSKEPVETRCRWEAPADLKAEVAETKRVSKETRKAKEKTTSNDSLKLEILRCALLYIERARNGRRGVARGERSPRARQRVP